MIPFPGRLRYFRRRAHMTQAALAEASGLAPVTVARLETGQNRPTAETVAALADALKVHPARLVGTKEDTCQS